MICPECENGKVFHRMAHVRASKDFGKFTKCLHCNGSGLIGEHSQDGSLLIGDQATRFRDNNIGTD